MAWSPCTSSTHRPRGHVYEFAEVRWTKRTPEDDLETCLGRVMAPMSLVEARNGGRHCADTLGESTLQHRCSRDRAGNSQDFVSSVPPFNDLLTIPPRGGHFGLLASSYPLVAVAAVLLSSLHTFHVSLAHVSSSVYIKVIWNLTLETEVGFAVGKTSFDQQLQ